VELETLVLSHGEGQVPLVVHEWQGGLDVSAPDGYGVVKQAAVHVDDSCVWKRRMQDAAEQQVSGLLIDHPIRIAAEPFQKSEVGPRRVRSASGRRRRALGSRRSCPRRQSKASAPLRPSQGVAGENLFN